MCDNVRELAARRYPLQLKLKLDEGMKVHSSFKPGNVDEQCLAELKSDVGKCTSSLNEV